MDSRYLNKYDRSTVSRWESGDILPKTRRIEVFGEALGLSRAEVDGLLSLADLDAYATESPIAEIQAAPEPSDISDIAEAPLTDVAENSGCAQTPSYIRFAVGYVWSRFALPGSIITLAGYLMATLGWNSPFMLAIYVGGALFGMTAWRLWRLRRSDDLGDLLFITVFFLLSVYLLQAPLTYMDIYDLYSLGNFAGTSIPFTLSLIMNLFVATIAGLMFARLRIWQHSSRSGDKSVYGRAAWIAIPPVVFVYAFILAFANIGLWIAGLALFTMLAGAVTTLLALRDKDVSIDEWDRKFLLCATSAVVIMLAALGIAAILIAYAQSSSFPETDMGLFYSQEKDFDALGYSADEYPERSNLAAAWGSLVTLAYMVTVIGGKLLVTIYRLDGGDSVMPAAAPAGAPLSDLAQRQAARGSQFDLRYRAACFFRHPVFRLRGGLPRFPSW